MVSRKDFNNGRNFGKVVSPVQEITLKWRVLKKQKLSNKNFILRVRFFKTLHRKYLYVLSFYISISSLFCVEVRLSVKRKFVPLNFIFILHSINHSSIVKAEQNDQI